MSPAKALLAILSVLIILFMAIGLALFHGSGAVPSIATAAQGELSSPEAPRIITVGNRSYVPLNLVGGSTANARTILEAIQLFESLHNELHVTSFHVERNYHTPSSQWVTNPPEFIVGVWLTHEPR